MFGYRVEPDFNLGREQRRDRLWWVMVAGLCVLGVFFLIHPFSRMVFIAYSLTFLSYGNCFYVKRNDKVGEKWLWKAVLATLPLHFLILGGIGWVIWTLPGFAKTAISSVAFVAICFAVESELFDSIAGRFEPSRLAHSPL